MTINEDEDDSYIAPSTVSGALAAWAKSSLMQPWLNRIGNAIRLTAG
jgi:hypothetical protein